MAMNNTIDIYDFIKSVVSVFRNYDTPSCDQLCELADGNIVKVTFTPLKHVYYRRGKRKVLYAVFTGHLVVTTSDDMFLGTIAIDGDDQVTMVACALLMTKVGYEPQCVKDYEPWSEPHEPEYIPTHWDG